MDRLRPILLIVAPALLAFSLAGCGSSGSDTRTANTGSPGPSASSAPSSGAGPSATAGATSTSSAGTTSAAGAKGPGKQAAAGVGGYASGVGSGPASSRCALTAAQVGTVVGEPVKATSLESSGGGLACYFRSTSSTSPRDLTVTVQKVAVPGLYEQSRKLNAGGTTTTSQEAGGRFFFVGVQTVGRTDRTPAQLLAVSQILAAKLAG